MFLPDESLTGSSLPESAGLAQFNKSWAELIDWLTMLDNMVQNKRVVVADLDDINSNINQLKVNTYITNKWITSTANKKGIKDCKVYTLSVFLFILLLKLARNYKFCCLQECLQELDQRRPILERQITAAQNLKNKTSNQETRNAITERSMFNSKRKSCSLKLERAELFLSLVAVDRLQAHWEDSQTKLSDRMKQLHNMLQDSIDWLDAKKRVDHLIKQASERLESWQEITYTVDALKKQNTELKVR